mmetsp:Transcript_1655/g.4531  ORF Transcript_1655/g.4531 Transcript_1655/m.4531 type:complete len:200 (+) Transcript_1655:3-602(+)
MGGTGREGEKAVDYAKAAVVRFDASEGLKGGFGHALALCRTGEALIELNKLDEANDILSKAFSFIEAQFGAGDIRTGLALTALARLYARTGDAVSAEGLFRGVESKLNVDTPVYVESPCAWHPSMLSVAALGTANYLHFADMLDKLSWNNTPRSAEAEACRRKARALRKACGLQEEGARPEPGRALMRDMWAAEMMSGK